MRLASKARSLAAADGVTLIERRGGGSVGEVSGTRRVDSGPSVASRTTEGAVVAPSVVEGPAGFGGARGAFPEGGAAARGGGRTSPRTRTRPRSGKEGEEERLDRAPWTRLRGRRREERRLRGQSCGTAVHVPAHEAVAAG